MSWLQHSLEQAERLIKEHEGFITTMDANDEKINNVLQFAGRLVDEGHYSDGYIQEKAESLKDRCGAWRRTQLHVHVLFVYRYM